jgi:demethoxyubiquinone hydroxylase (CLK1/Coq7/Cat5 family)
MTTTLSLMRAAAEVPDHELRFLNFYRASELHGGLILGQVARRTRDAVLSNDLLKHSAEEVEHARVWTETIIRVGGRVQPVRNTYQSRYAEAIGRPVGVLHVLALTQIFERRVYRHFTEHLRRPNTHPAVQAALRQMLEEEKGHLSWVKHWLDQQALTRGSIVHEIMRRYAEVDRQVYAALTLELGWRMAA